MPIKPFVRPLMPNGMNNAQVRPMQVMFGNKPVMPQKNNMQMTPQLKPIEKAPVKEEVKKPEEKKSDVVKK
jgi:hypothetical protein